MCSQKKLSRFVEPATVRSLSSSKSGLLRPESRENTLHKWPLQTRTYVLTFFSLFSFQANGAIVIYKWIYEYQCTHTHKYICMCVCMYLRIAAWCLHLVKNYLEMQNYISAVFSFCYFMLLKIYLFLQFPLDQNVYACLHQYVCLCTGLCLYESMIDK